MKWSFLPTKSPKPRYLCVNADESEPGTFKDRMLMEVSPHLLVEGDDHLVLRHQSRTTPLSTSAASCPYAEQQWSARCARPMTPRLLGKNILGSGFDLEITVHRGAGRLHRGEESALLESLEGKRGSRASSRRSRRSSASTAARRSSTTSRRSRPCRLSSSTARRCTPPMGPRRAKARALLPERACRAPRQLRAAAGHAARTLIEDYGGGIRGGQALKAIIPGGSSTPFLTPIAARYAAGLSKRSRRPARCSARRA